MNGDRVAEAEQEEEGKSLRTVDGVGQNGGMRCKVGQRRQEREEALAFINSRERHISFNLFYNPDFVCGFLQFLALRARFFFHLLVARIGAVFFQLSVFHLAPKSAR